MTLLLQLNLGFAWGAVAPPTFNPVWCMNRNSIIGQTDKQPVQK